jgi:hypothetical protein
MVKNKMEDPMSMKKLLLGTLNPMYLCTLVKPQHSESEVDCWAIPIEPSAVDALFDRFSSRPSFCESVLLVALGLGLGLRRS